MYVTFYNSQLWINSNWNDGTNYIIQKANIDYFDKPAKQVKWNESFESGNWRYEAFIGLVIVRMLLKTADCNNVTDGISRTLGF